jgi:GTP cyclohydrolase II
MSQAFVKESDEQWLHEVQPTLNALIVYLTRENNGIRVYEKKAYMSQKHGREIHEMSNGLSYAKDDNGQWFIVW